MNRSHHRTDQITPQSSSDVVISLLHLMLKNQFRLPALVQISRAIRSVETSCDILSCISVTVLSRAGFAISMSLHPNQSSVSSVALWGDLPLLATVTYSKVWLSCPDSSYSVCLCASTGSFSITLNICVANRYIAVMIFMCCLLLLHVFGYMSASLSGCVQKCCKLPTIPVIQLLCIDSY